jgi:hypothetical protein
MDLGGNKVVWIVSFNAAKEGGEPARYPEYTVETLNLSEVPERAVKALQSKIGKGVFHSEREAKQWAAGQTNGGGCGCGRQGNCCKEQ